MIIVIFGIISFIIIFLCAKNESYDIMDAIVSGFWGMIAGVILGGCVFFVGSSICYTYCETEPVIKDTHYIADFTFNFNDYYSLTVEDNEYGYWCEDPIAGYSYKSVPINQTHIHVTNPEDVARVVIQRTKLKNPTLNFLFGGMLENEYIIYLPNNNIRYG